MTIWTPEQLARIHEDLGESDEIAEAIASARRMLSKVGVSRRTKEVLRVLADYAERVQSENRRNTISTEDVIRHHMDDLLDRLSMRD